MAAGLTAHVWTLREVLLFRVPPWPQPQVRQQAREDTARQTDPRDGSRNPAWIAFSPRVFLEYRFDILAELESQSHFVRALRTLEEVLFELFPHGRRKFAQ